MNQTEIIAELKLLTKAFDNAVENDYCTDEFSEYEGLDPNGITERIIRFIKEL